MVLKGSVNKVENLPLSANIGDLYVVSETGDGYVWNGSSWDNAGPIRGPQGEKGEPGKDGKDGANGLTTYVHFAYSTSPNGSTNFSIKYFDGASYMGSYVDTIKEDSQDYTDYEWKKFKGEKGEKGEDGENGETYYLHIAYATGINGENFSTTYFPTATYMGTYTSTTPADSTDYKDYEWKKFVGDKGDDGENGTSISLRGTVNTVDDLPGSSNIGDLYIVADSGDGYT